MLTVSQDHDHEPSQGFGKLASLMQANEPMSSGCTTKMRWHGSKRSFITLQREPRSSVGQPTSGPNVLQPRPSVSGEILEALWSEAVRWQGLAPPPVSHPNDHGWSSANRLNPLDASPQAPKNRTPRRLAPTLGLTLQPLRTLQQRSLRFAPHLACRVPEGRPSPCGYASPSILGASIS